MINRYEIGDLVRVSGPFTNSQDGTPVDPDQVFFSYVAPSGALVTMVYGVDSAVVRNGPGDYHCDVNVNASGRWYWRWHSTGSGQGADEGEFYVKPSPFST